MPERSYTVHELDALRHAVEMKYLFGSYRGPQGIAGTSRCYREDEMRKTVEEMVRTHILAGHTADDLIESAPDRGVIVMPGISDAS